MVASRIWRCLSRSSGVVCSGSIELYEAAEKPTEAAWLWKHVAGKSTIPVTVINSTLPVEGGRCGCGGGVGPPHLEQLLEYGHAVDEGRLAVGAARRVGKGPEIHYY